MSYAQTGEYPAKTNCPKFTNTCRWHLAMQNIKTTGRLGHPVCFNQAGWRKWTIVIQSYLRLLIPQDNQK